MQTVYEKRLVKEKVVQEFIIEESLDAPRKVTEFFIEKYGINERLEEYVYLICFDSRLRVLGIYEISHGSDDYAIFDTKNIFSRALLSLASGIILVHNHPSGDITPSEDDDKTQDILMQCGKMLNIKVVDSIIIGDKNYYSYRDNSHFYTSS